jgi:hypothetical protein
MAVTGSDVEQRCPKVLFVDRLPHKRSEVWKPPVLIEPQSCRRLETMRKCLVRRRPEVRRP